MKNLIVQSDSRTFRLPTTLNEKIENLARAIPQHPSDLIRAAVQQYVSFYSDPTHLKELQP